MSNAKTSLKDAWKSASASAVAIGVAANIGMTAGIGSIGMVAGAVGLAASSMASLTFGKRKKTEVAVVEAVQAETAPEEFDISVETGAPVKAMKTIRLRR